MDATRPMEAMGDLIEAVKKANWHTIGVMIPGITFLLIVSKIYVDTSQESMRAIFDERISSVRMTIKSIESDQNSTSSDISRLRADMMTIFRDRRASCIKNGAGVKIMNR